MQFEATPKDLFFKSINKDDLRFGEKTQNSNFDKAAWILRGYPDDEGIQLNGGRPGAAGGPLQIRRFFYKTTSWSSDPLLFDVGNISLDSPIEERHEFCRKSLKDTLLLGKKSICLGGGHDYGYPDGAGFLDVFKDQNPLVINFDAHLDVRNLDRGLSSGTPFFRLLNEFNGQFEFLEVGIQPQCNSENHWKWLLDKGAKILSLNELSSPETSLIEKLKANISNSSLKRPCFISLDIDVFSNSVAPGCSQSWPWGLSLEEFFNCLKWMIDQFDIKVFGIYEVSPPLDIDDRTSKLAAQVLAHLLRDLGQK